MIHPKPPEAIVNPYELALAKHLQEQEEKADPKAFLLRRQSAAWQAEQAEQAKCEARLNNPTRQKAIQHAQSELAAIQLDPRQSAGAVYDAEQRLRMLQESDVSCDTYVRMCNEARQVFGAKLKENGKALAAQHQASQDEIKRAMQPFVLPASENVVFQEE